MSDTATPPPPKGRMAGWVKALIASLLSALSGAVLMYTSSLVDMVIKPAKPVANFEAQASGLKVVFQNKSTGGHEGWWDFGDGAALEPFVADQLAVTHAYAKAGSYPVKLSLKNLLGDENDRNVTVVVDEGGGTFPIIESFTVVPVQGEYAPATYRVETKVKNANLCVWAVGNRALEFSPETAQGDRVRLVTFKDPGPHFLKLAAYNGREQPVEKTVQVVVNKAPVGLVTATVELTYEAASVERKSGPAFVQVRFPADVKDSTAIVQKAVAADVGFEIVKAEPTLSAKDTGIKVTKVEIDRVKKDKVMVTCEVTRPSGRTQSPAHTVKLALEQQRISPATVKKLDPVSVNLTTPGQTSVPMPALGPEWVVTSRKITLTLQQDAKQYTFNDGNLPHSFVVQMSPSAEYMVDAVEQNGQLWITLTPIKKAWSTIGR